MAPQIIRVFESHSNQRNSCSALLDDGFMNSDVLLIFFNNRFLGFKDSFKGSETQPNGWQEASDCTIRTKASIKIVQ